jgi:hypothetical protein
MRGVIGDPFDVPLARPTRRSAFSGLTWDLFLKSRPRMNSLFAFDIPGRATLCFSALLGVFGVFVCLLEVRFLS